MIPLRTIEGKILFNLTERIRPSEMIVPVLFHIPPAFLHMFSLHVKKLEWKRWEKNVRLAEMEKTMTKCTGKRRSELMMMLMNHVTSAAAAEQNRPE